MYACRAKTRLSDKSFIRQTPLQLNEILHVITWLADTFEDGPLMPLSSLYTVCGLKFGNICFCKEKKIMYKLEWISQFTDKAKVLSCGRSLNDIALIWGGHKLTKLTKTGPKKPTAFYCYGIYFFFYNEKILWKCQNPGYPAWPVNIISSYMEKLEGSRESVLLSWKLASNSLKKTLASNSLQLCHRYVIYRSGN